uniref:RRM domain-containing protein n=1 Tax=Strongyloides papillosus TaxID=174720 RepID=A0A0N5BRB0_STREA
MYSDIMDDDGDKQLMEPDSSDNNNNNNNNNNDGFYSLKLVELDSRCSPYDLLQFCTSKGLTPYFVDSFSEGIGIVAFRKLNDLEKFIEVLNSTPAIPLLVGGLTFFSIDDTEKKGRKRKSVIDGNNSSSKHFKRDY